MTNINRAYLIKDKKDIFFISLIDRLLGIIAAGRQREMPRKIKNILIIKPCHLGDVLMMTAVLPLIKEKYPKANIDIVIGDWAAVVLRNNPYIRRIYTVNHNFISRKNKSRFSKRLEFYRTYMDSLCQVRKSNYDISLNMRKYRGNLVTFEWLSKSKYNIGYGTSGFGPLFDKEIVWRSGLHEVESFLAVLKPLGIKAKKDELNYQLFCDKSDEVYVDNIIKENNLTEFIVIHPFSGARERMLPAEFWVDLVNCINEKQIVFCGTVAEREMLELIKKDIKKETYDFLGRFSIAQLFLFYKRARLIYSVESLSSHIAAMTGNKVISFYSKDPLQWGPLGKTVTVIRNRAEYLEKLRQVNYCYDGNRQDINI